MSRHWTDYRPHVTLPSLPNLRSMNLPSLHRGRRDVDVARGSLGAGAAGAIALGALAIGAIAIGALAINRLAVKRARIDRLSVGRLEVDELVISERGTPEPQETQ